MNKYVLIIYLEGFVLPMLATAVVTVIVLNPMNLDWRQRGALLVTILAIAYLVALTVTKGL